MTDCDWLGPMQQHRPQGGRLLQAYSADVALLLLALLHGHVPVQMAICHGTGRELETETSETGVGNPAPLPLRSTDGLLGFFGVTFLSGVAVGLLKDCWLLLHSRNAVNSTWTVNLPLRNGNANVNVSSFWGTTLNK